MSSDEETVQLDPPSVDQLSLPSFNLVATPSAGEEVEIGPQLEDTKNFEETQSKSKRKRSKLDQLQAELWELRETMGERRREHRVETYRPSTFKPRAILTDNFQLFAKEFCLTLPDQLSLIFNEKEVPPDDDLDVDDVTLYELHERFRARNAQAFHCLSTTLMECGKLRLISNCQDSDGIGAWKYLKDMAQGNSNMSSAEAIAALLTVSRPAAETVTDFALKADVEAAVVEVSRQDMLDPKRAKKWAMVVYLSALPASLNDVKRAVLLNSDKKTYTPDEIYALVKAQRAFALANPGTTTTEATAAKATFQGNKKDKPPFKKYVYEKPTEEERAGICTVCGKSGHGARTCRKRFRNGKSLSAKTSSSNTKPIVEGNLAYFDGEVDAFHGEIGVSHRLHGKAFSSDNEGDGPPKRVSLPIGRISNAARELIRLVIDTRARLDDFVNDTIGASDSIILVTTLSKWGWDYPEEDLRSFKSEYTSKSVRDRGFMLRWIEAMQFPYCRPDQFQARERDAYPYHINSFDFARRGYLAGVETDWTRESVILAMFGDTESGDPFVEPCSIISNPVMRLTGASSTRTETKLESVQEEFREFTQSPAYVSMDQDDRRYLRNSYLDLVHNAMISLREIEHFLDNLIYTAELGHVSTLDLCTLRAIRIISAGFQENSSISRLLMGKIQAQPWSEDPWNVAQVYDPVVEYNMPRLDMSETEEQAAYRRVESSSSSAAMDPNHYPLQQTVQPVAADTEIEGLDATVIPIAPALPTTEPTLLPIASPVSSDDGLWSSSEDDEWKEVYPVLYAPESTDTEDNVEPPRKFGKGFSSDNMGDGPSTFSKGTNSDVGVGHRPKVVKFLLDSGCSHHMVDSNQVRLSDARATRIKINGIDPTRPMLGDQVGRFGPLAKVLGVPGLTKNLISVGAACAAGYKFLFSRNGATIYAESDVLFNEPILKGKLINNIFYLELNETPNTYDTDLYLPSTQIAMPASIIPLNRAALWHARFGHIAQKTIRNLIDQDMVDGIESKPTKNMWTELEQVRCEACVKGKMTMAPVSRTSTNVEVVKTTTSTENKYAKGQMICIDLLTSSVESLGKARYALTILDVGTHYMWTYFLKSKNAEDVREAMRCWLLEIKKDGITPEAFMTIRSDNGSEFIEAETKELLQANGIKHDRAPPHHHVYAIERLNRTLQEMTRSLLAHAKLPAKYWAEALNVAAYTLNRLPCKPHQKHITRFQAYFGTKPDVSHMRTFGSYCWVRNYDAKLKIWDDRATRHRFLGYPKDSSLSWRVGTYARLQSNTHQM